MRPAQSPGPLKVFGWANDHFGCGNYRIGLPMWGLRMAGHDATAFSVLNMDIPTDLDVLVGQLVADEAKSTLWQTWARRNDRFFAMVYEIDDDIWTLTQCHPALNHFEGEPGQRVIENIRVADAVTVTTDHLAELVAQWNPNVTVLPNCFDATMLRHERPHADGLTLGWAGGSGHHNDFMSVAKDLRTFFRKNPQVDTHFMGTNYGAAIGRPDTRFTGWKANLVDYHTSIDFDFGIAPLAFNAFNRSKSDLKFLEYAVLGIPVVATDFGPYSASVVDGETGLLVRHPHEWSRHLRAMASDADLRTQIGANAKAWAETRTIQANIWRWEQAYRNILGSVALANRPAA